MKSVVVILNTEKLSERLNTVASYVPQGARLADIGSDHAYLPCYLAHKGIISYGVAGEVVAGPFESARKQVLADGLSGLIDVRMGDGLEVIDKDEVDCITIAGMGGTLITSILEKGKDKLGSVKRLILQPNISAISIRKWLLENGWELVDEKILEEDGKIYEILVAVNGDARRPYEKNIELELLLGPFLLRRQDPSFKKKWALEMANWLKIYTELNKAAESDQTLEKKQDLLKKIELVKGVLEK